MARPKKAKISSKTPSPAYWKNKLKSLFSSPAEALAFSETFDRLEREKADALAADLAAALDANPDVIRAKLRTLFNDLYRLNDESNDWWNETQRAEAEAEAMAAFAEKLEDLSLDVKRSQQSRKRRPAIEARRPELDALILAEVDAATAAVRESWPDDAPLREKVNYEIADALERKGVNGGKRIGIKRIRQARRGR